MAKYLYRTCPKCKDYPGVVVPESPEPAREVPIDAYCLRCGFKLALDNHIKTVKEVEDRSGLNFFWELPGDVETELETEKDADFINTWLGIQLRGNQ